MSSMEDEKLCLECSQPKSNHPLVILSEGAVSFNGSSNDGLLEHSDDETRITLFGMSWRVKSCKEFVDSKQLELF